MLSQVSRANQTPSSAYPLYERVRDAIIRPRELFRRLGDASPWLDMLLVMTLAAGTLSAGFWSSAVGIEIQTNARVAALEFVRARDSLSDVEYAALVERVESSEQQHESSAAERLAVQVTRATTSFVVSAIVTSLLVHILVTVIYRATFLQYRRVFSIVCHASAIWLVEACLLALLSYATREPKTMASLPQLMPNGPWPEPPEFPGVLLATFDVFNVWALIVIAIGIARAIDRRPLLVAAGLVTAFVFASIVRAVTDSHVEGVLSPFQ